MTPIFFNAEEQSMLTEVVDYTCDDRHMQKQMWQDVIESMNRIKDILYNKNNNYSNLRFHASRRDIINLFCACNRYMRHMNDCKTYTSELDSYDLCVRTVAGKLQHYIN